MINSSATPDPSEIPQTSPNLTEEFFEVESPKLFKMIHCSTFDCQETLQFRSVCRIYLNASSPDCNVPCQLETCEIAVRENIICPIWTCQERPTTTPAPSPPTPPGPATNSGCEGNGLCISSLSFNAIFFVLIAGVLAQFWKKKRINRRAFLSDEENIYGRQPPSAPSINDIDANRRSRSASLNDIPTWSLSNDNYPATPRDGFGGTSGGPSSGVFGNGSSVPSGAPSGGVFGHHSSVPSGGAFGGMDDVNLNDDDASARSSVGIISDSSASTKSKLSSWMKTKKSKIRATLGLDAAVLDD